MNRHLRIRAGKFLVFAMIAMQVVFAGGSNLAAASSANSAHASLTSATSTVSTETGTPGNGKANGHKDNVSSDTSGSSTTVESGTATTVESSTTTAPAEQAPQQDVMVTQDVTVDTATTTPPTVTADTSATTPDATVTQDTTVTTDTAAPAESSTASSTVNESSTPATDPSVVTESTAIATDTSATASDTPAADTALSGGVTADTATTVTTTTIVNDPAVNSPAADTTTTATTTDTTATTTTVTDTAAIASVSAPSGGSSVSAPTLTTDRQKYSLGAYVTLTGSGFLPSAAVTISIVRPDKVTDVVGATTDANGAFTAYYAPNPAPAGRYNATATDGTNSATAAFTQADAIGYGKGVYNKGTTSPSDTTGVWTTGNAGSNYLEDQWAYYQYEITGITTSGTVPSFDVYFNHYQQNTNAVFIDAFANFRACIDCAENSNTSGPNQGMLTDGVPYPSGTSTAKWVIVPATSASSTGIPVTKVNNTFNTSGNVCGGSDPVNSPGDDHCFHVDGASLAQLFPGKFTGGQTHTITLFYEAHLAATFTWLGGHEGQLNNPSSIYYVNPGPEVLPAGVVYGTDAYSGWTAPFEGVGAATGSSRHFNIINQTAGSSGQLSLPIPTVPVSTGSITITKVTVPAVATGTTFSFSGDLGSFNLDTDPNTTSTPSSTTFSQLPGGFPFSVTEGTNAGWTLASINCTSTAGTNTSTVSTSTRTATITLANGGAVSCTYTNVLQQARLTLVKQVVNTHGGTATSTAWTLNASGTTPISGVTGSSAVTNAPVQPGTYSLSESGGPGGYVASLYSCVKNGGAAVSGNSVTLAPGDSATCTITNSDTAGTLIVHKVTIPADDPTVFSITLSPAPSSGSSTRSLSTATDTVYAVNAGTYNVTEATTTGWMETSSTCSGVVVPNGGSASCTITNTKLAKFTLVKDTVGGDGTFNFTMTGTSLPASTTLTTASGTASTTFSNLVPGDYSVTEIVPAGWHESSVYCGGAVPGVASAWYSAYNPGDPISIDPGEEVTCTFTNNKPQAEITLTPLTATNAVGMDHTVTSTVLVNVGDGNWVPAPTGTIVTFSLLNNTANAGFVTPSTCATDANGMCSITINATSTGSVDIHATASPVVLGVTIPVATDGTGGNSVDAEKTYVNARISIGPSATNEVGDPHTFTVTVQENTGSGFTGVSGVNPTVTFGTSTPSSVTDNCATTGTNASGTCTVVVNSNVAGVFTATASATLTVDGVGFSISTDGTGQNSGPATKTYVDGSIALSPLTAVNAIGQPHTITAHVTENDGTGVANASGVTVDFTISSGTAAFVGSSTCVTAADGTCSIQINSNSTGANTVDASATFSVGGVSLTRATDGNYGPDGTGSAEKTYVNATISIVPTATNEVGDPHTFTVTVLEDTGSGLTGVSGVNPVVTIDPTPASTTDTCASAGTNASGTCSVTIDSFVSGTFTASATLQLTVGGVTFNLITDGTGGSSGPATKTYVDAQILISSSSVNEVGNPHTFTVTVNENLGDGNGFVPLSGATVASSISGTGSIAGGTCVSGTTDANGECTIIVSSTVSGVATVHASTTVDVGGVSITRSTGDSLSGDSPDSTKTWVDANISLTPASDTDPIGDHHVLTAHVNVNGGSGFVNAPDGTVIDFSIVSGPGSLSSSTCTTSGGTGSCTTTLTSLVAGTTTVNAATDVTVGGLSLSRSTGDAKTGDSDNAIKAWVAGGLTVTKIVSGLASVVGSSTISQDFNVTVTGPSYPSGTAMTFHLVNGVLQAPTSQTLYPLIPGNYTVTEANAGAVWQETVPTSSIAVVGNSTSTATVTNAYLPGSLEVTKALVLDGYNFASTTNATFTIAVAGPSYPAPTGTVLTFNVTNGVVSGPQTLGNLIPGNYSVIESDPGIAWAVTNQSSTVTVSPASSSGDTVTNTVKLPHTTISITPNVYDTLPGENVILTISDTNDGQVPLTDPSVTLTIGTTTVTLDATHYYTSGDTNNNGVMDVGETWTWTYQLIIYANTTFTVDGHGYDPLGNDVSPENGYTTENGTVTVNVVNTTRTLGFWQTHTGFTDYVFNLASMQQYVGVDLPVSSTTSKGIITDTQSTGASQLLGGFYAPVAKTTTGAKRNPVDQARIVLLQQLLAAKLNCAAFGCTASTTALIAQADADYHNGNKAGMSTDTSLLDAFNNSGDTFAIPASLPATGKATPSISKSYANLVFWNNP